jgi:hypothetical protein
VEVFGRELRALAVFGSSVYSGRYRDVDLLVVVDRLGSAREKLELEVRIGESLRDLPLGRYFDVSVLDVPSLEENAAPGGFLSGLVLGYRVICDEVGLDELVLRVAGELARLDTYEVREGGRRVDLSAVARAVLTSPRPTGAPRARCSTPPNHT